MPKLPLKRSCPVSSPVIRAEVLLERARKLLLEGKPDQVRAMCEKVLAADAMDPDALTLLGIARAEECHLGEAVSLFERAIRVAPDHAEAWRNRGTALSDIGLLDQALVSFDRAVALQPDFPMGHALRAMTLYRLGRFEDAVTAHDPIMALTEQNAAMMSNRATALLWSGRIDEAIADLDRAVRLDPEHASAWTNKALAQLLLGDLPNGFRNFEWRWKRPEQASAMRHYSRPRWTGQIPLAGKTLLLYAEQGFGDTIQFCRYASLAMRAGARVILQVQPALVGLLRTLRDHPCVIGTGDPLPDFDLHCPLMSVPIGFETTIDTIPAEIPYLHAMPEQVARWHTVLPPASAPRIGLVWAGGSFTGHADQSAFDRRRSTTLSALAPLSAVRGCEFVSLQVGPAAARADASDGGLIIESHTDQLNDFSDTAALIETLDLVIGVDTAVIHLAGALGKPVWLLNRFDTDWRWLLKREDSPWYPTMRQFRQTKPGDWDGVIQQVVQALGLFVATWGDGSNRPPLL